MMHEQIEKELVRLNVDLDIGCQSLSNLPKGWVLVCNDRVSRMAYGHAGLVMAALSSIRINPARVVRKKMGGWECDDPECSERERLHSHTYEKEITASEDGIVLDLVWRRLDKFQPMPPASLREWEEVGAVKSITRLRAKRAVIVEVEANGGTRWACGRHASILSDIFDSQEEALAAIENGELEYFGKLPKLSESEQRHVEMMRKRA